jgi:hypothetical protein
MTRYEAFPGLMRLCVSAEESIDESSLLLLPHVLVGLGRIISGCRPYRLSQRIYSQVSEKDLLSPERILTYFDYCKLESTN